MKGLLKNNFYAVRSSATIFSIFMLIVGTIVIVIDSQQFFAHLLAIGYDWLFNECDCRDRERLYFKMGKIQTDDPSKKRSYCKELFYPSTYMVVCRNDFCWTCYVSYMAVTWLPF